MKIYHNQLPTTLKQAFKPVWLVFGDEPWQKNDSLSQIKQFAQQQGFDEVIRFSADDKFDWQELVQEYQAMSLFSSRRIIEVELVKTKLTEPAAKILLALSEGFHDDVQLIFHGAKIDLPTQKKKWFKAYEAAGCFLPLYDIEGKQLSMWLNRQAQHFKLNLSHEVSTLLIELFEGNLSSLSQELEKLSLLFAQQLISLEDVEHILTKQAKFNPFQLIDALLLGNLPKCMSILSQLQNEGTAVGQIVWALHKEISQLYNMLEQKGDGQTLEQLYKSYRVWDKRKPFYRHALTSISIDNIRSAQARLAQVDLLSKTTSDFNAYILLSDVCTTLYHGEVTSQFSLDYEFS